MAHLHVVSVHPFRDGNGRISRITQSLVLAREGLLSPEFASIEEYLGEHTPDYYNALQQVQGGRYQPERDAPPGSASASTRTSRKPADGLEQIEQAAARWTFLEQLAEERGWPDRFVIALEQALDRRYRPRQLQRRSRRLASLSDQRLPTPPRRRLAHPTRPRTKHPLPRKRRTPPRRCDRHRNSAANCNA